MAKYEAPTPELPSVSTPNLPNKGELLDEKKLLDELLYNDEFQYKDEFLPKSRILSESIHLTVFKPVADSKQGVQEEP